MNTWIWLPLAIGSALFAALVAIFGKLGLKNIDSSLATMLRSGVMFIFLLLFVVGTGKIYDSTNVSARDWLWILLAGLAGALSWLLYFGALKFGKVSQVAPIDRLSMVFVVMLAIIFLGEKLGLQSGLGILLMTVGAILVALG